MSHSRCGLCHQFHYPKCKATTAVWPVAPLIEEFGTVKLREATSHRTTWPEFIDDRTADRWAIRLGVHPEYVWPGWCDAALTVGDNVFVNGTATAGPGWRQAWDWTESQRCDLPAGNPEGGQGDQERLGGRENANEAAIVGPQEAVA